MTEVERTRKHIKGEAYALRAFRYFYLVNMYAAPYDPATCATTRVFRFIWKPLLTTRRIGGFLWKKVYGQIVDDLKNAIPLLEENLMETEKHVFLLLQLKHY